MRSLSHRATWCTTCVCAVWASAILCVVRRPLRTTGARVPHLPVTDYHGSASLLVWLEQSSHDVDFQLLTFVLHLHKLCCQLCCQLCCTDYIFIFQIYLSYTWHLKNNNRQNVTPALKNRFLDLTPHITRHSCRPIISAELVVSSFINNHVPQFPPLQTGAANSCLAFSVAPYRELISCTLIDQ